jgi:hypothetical protein
MSGPTDRVPGPLDREPEVPAPCAACAEKEGRLAELTQMYQIAVRIGLEQKEKIRALQQELAAFGRGS